jgi:hypothetical protein
MNVPDYINEVGDLSDYAVVRYPGEDAKPTEKEYREAVISAEKCLVWVKSIVFNDNNLFLHN